MRVLPIHSSTASTRSSVRFHTVERTAYPRYAWSEDPQPQKPVGYDVEWIIDGWERITFADVEPDQIGHIGGLIQGYLDAHDRQIPTRLAARPYSAGSAAKVTP